MDLSDAVIVDETCENRQKIADTGAASECRGRSAMVSAGKVIAIGIVYANKRAAFLFDQASNQMRIVHTF